VVPTIVALREHAESIRKSELEKSLPKMGGLSDKQIKQIDGLTQSIINKLLHNPLVTLKKSTGDPDGGSRIEAVRVLFGLEEGPEAGEETKEPAGSDAGVERSRT